MFGSAESEDPRLVVISREIICEVFRLIMRPRYLDNVTDRRTDELPLQNALCVASRAVSVLKHGKRR